jgi:hypothetical protein
MLCGTGCRPGRACCAEPRAGPRQGNSDSRWPRPRAAATCVRVIRPAGPCSHDVPSPSPVRGMSCRVPRPALMSYPNGKLHVVSHDAAFMRNMIIYICAAYRPRPPMLCASRFSREARVGGETCAEGIRMLCLSVSHWAGAQGNRRGMARPRPRPGAHAPTDTTAPARGHQTSRPSAPPSSPAPTPTPTPTPTPIPTPSPTPTP